MPFSKATSGAQVPALGSSGLTHPVFVHFAADWCAPCTAVNTLLEASAKKHPEAVFLSVEAESFPDVSLSYDISAVPTVVAVIGGKIVGRVDGADTEAIGRLIATHASVRSAPLVSAPLPAAQPTTASPALAIIEKAVKSYPITVFMKGSKEDPQCGFSGRMINLLTKYVGLDKIHSVDVLKNEEVRAKIKEYSSFPTIPQLYLAGTFVGGVDIALEMESEGALGEEITSALAKFAAAQPDYKALVNKSKVMLFMKGSPEEPKCKFSRAMVELLKENGVSDYGHFDILGDQAVREGLKAYSNWPTYPQLYASGVLVGGLDIAKELAADGALRETLGL